MSVVRSSEARTLAAAKFQPAPALLVTKFASVAVPAGRGVSNTFSGDRGLSLPARSTAETAKNRVTPFVSPLTANFVSVVVPTRSYGQLGPLAHGDSYTR